MRMLGLYILLIMAYRNIMWRYDTIVVLTMNMAANKV